MPYAIGLQSLVETAKLDLAQRWNIPESEIGVLEAREFVWQDASLGCLHSGMAHKQVPEDGFLIRLEAPQTIYEYHTSGEQSVVLCDFQFFQLRQVKLTMVNLGYSIRNKINKKNRIRLVLSRILFNSKAFSCDVFYGLSPL